VRTGTHFPVSFEKKHSILSGGIQLLRTGQQVHTYHISMRLLSNASFLLPLNVSSSSGWSRVLPPEPHLIIVQFETVLRSWEIGARARTGHTDSPNETRKLLLRNLRNLTLNERTISMKLSLLISTTNSNISTTFLEIFHPSIFTTWMKRVFRWVGDGRIMGDISGIRRIVTRLGATISS
jgi:hypothetical protein